MVCDFDVCSQQPDFLVRQLFFVVFAFQHALFKKYWPEVDSKETFVNGIVVEGLKEERYADFCVRTMKVQYVSDCLF